MLTPTNQYASFLLRLQWMQNDGCPTWVASIQSTQTGELRRFSGIDALIQFLQAEFNKDDKMPEVESYASASPENRVEVSVL